MPTSPHPPNCTEVLCGSVLAHARRLAAPLSLGALLATAAGAQGAAHRPPRALPQPRVGMQVRLLARGVEHRGTIARRTRDSIVVRECTGCDATAYALADLAALERWHGRTSLASVARGAVVGAALGAVAGTTSERHAARHCVEYCSGPRGLEADLGALLGFVIGAVAGAGLGQHGRWEPLALPVAPTAAVGLAR